MAVEFGYFPRPADAQSHPLGDPAEWPARLRALLDVTMQSPLPTVLWWGDDAWMFFNRAYVPFLSVPDPAVAWGKAARDVLGNGWHLVRPVLEHVRARGARLESRTVPWEMATRGHRSERFWDVYYSAVGEGTTPNEAVQAVFVDVTDRHLHNRRLALLEGLGRLLEWQDGSINPLCELIVAHSDDIPFLLVYELEDELRTAALQFSLGWGNDTLALQRCACRGSSGLAGVMEQMLRTRRPQRFNEVESLFSVLPQRVGGAPSGMYGIVLACVDGSQRIALLGINPLRPWDAPYQSLLDTAARMICTIAARPLPREERIASGSLSPRILVVDANTNDRMYVTNILARKYRVDTAADAATGMELARRHRPSLILVDALLGGTGAYGLMRALRRQGIVPATPLILMTARAQNADPLEGLETSGMTLLPKPFGAKQLVAAAEEALRSVDQHVDTDAETWIAQEVLRAEERERERLMNHLHDHLAQSLVLARMTLEAAAKRVESDSLLKDLGNVDGLIADAIAFTRSLLTDQQREAQRAAGLVEALRKLAARMKRHHLDVEVRAPDEAGLATKHVLCVVECTRELLINVVKHAGTLQAIVRAEPGEAGECIITVEDQGHGFSPEPFLDSRGGTYGLRSVADRIKGIGGAIEVRSQRGAGTRIVMHIPSDL